jgi:hypothetical protein
MGEKQKRGKHKAEMGGQRDHGWTRIFGVKDGGVLGEFLVILQIR